MARNFVVGLPDMVVSLVEIVGNRSRATFRCHWTGTYPSHTAVHVGFDHHVQFDRLRGLLTTHSRRQCHVGDEPHG